MNDAVLFSAEAADRIADAVEWVEDRQENRSPLPRRRPVHAPAQVYTARLTSGTADANGRYPAVITRLDPSTETWADFSGAVKVEPYAGEALVNNTRYEVRPVGPVAGTPVYRLLAPPAASLTVTSIDPGTGDSTVSMAGVTTLEADLASGIAVVQITPSIAELQLLPVTKTHYGAVTGIDQGAANRMWKALACGSLPAGLTDAGVGSFTDHILTGASVFQVWGNSTLDPVLEVQAGSPFGSNFPGVAVFGFLNVWTVDNAGVSGGLFLAGGTTLSGPGATHISGAGTTLIGPCQISGTIATAANYFGADHFQAQGFNGITQNVSIPLPNGDNITVQFVGGIITTYTYTAGSGTSYVAAGDTLDGGTV